jgi:hypothetical protein
LEKYIFTFKISKNYIFYLWLQKYIFIYDIIIFTPTRLNL